MPDACAGRWRIVESGGPASLSELDHALFDGDLRGAGDQRLRHRRQREAVRVSPCQRAGGPTTAAAAIGTGQSAISVESAAMRSSLVGTPGRADRRHVARVRAAAATEHGHCR